MAACHGMTIAFLCGMKVLVVSNDQELLQTWQSVLVRSSGINNLKAETSDVLDLMSMICSERPSLLIIDDDYIQPNTGHLLRSVRKVNQNLKIMFITSNTSIDLGREISPLGIYYYTYKPIDVREFVDSVSALMRSHELNQS